PGLRMGERACRGCDYCLASRRGLPSTGKTVVKECFRVARPGGNRKNVTGVSLLRALRCRKQITLTETARYRVNFEVNTFEVNTLKPFTHPAFPHSSALRKCSS